MHSLYVKAILAGLFFGLWPLFMNRSGLPGMLSSIAFSGLVFLFVLPFALKEVGLQMQINWLMLLIAGVCGAIGVTFFNGMLAKAPKENVATFFVVMIIVQTAVPAIYHIFINGGISITKIVGFILAAIAATLIIKG